MMVLDTSAFRKKLLAPNTQDDWNHTFMWLIQRILQQKELRRLMDWGGETLDLFSRPILILGETVYRCRTARLEMYGSRAQYETRHLVRGRYGFFTPPIQFTATTDRGRVGFVTRSMSANPRPSGRLVLRPSYIAFWLEGEPPP